MGSDPLPRRAADAPLAAEGGRGGGLGEALGNHRYRGQAFGWVFLVLVGALNLGRGCIHVFKSDGGAGSIAGIDLSQNGEVILTLFASMGLSQVLLGVVDVVVALRSRALVPLLVGYHLIQQLGASAILWWWRPLPVDAPGKFGAVALVPVAAVAFYCATRRRPAGPRPAPD